MRVANRSRLNVLITVATILLLPASKSHAEFFLPTEAASDSRGAAELAEIVVTAQKREERALEVPSSVTVISQADLLSRGATSLYDISALVPGLNTSNGVGGNAVTIRGINASSGDVSSATSGVIIDGAPVGSSSGFALGGSAQLDLDPSDIQRVEVLRGPQGTLYGASTLGGLVSYVTRRASLESFDAMVGSEIADTEHGDISYTGRAAFDAPLVPGWLGLRVSGFYERKGGFIGDSLTGASNVNRADRDGGRVDLFFKPSSAVSIDLWGAIQKTNRNAEDFIVTDSNGHPTGEDLDYSQYVLPRREQEYRIVHASVDADLHFADLTYIGTYQESRSTIPENLTNQSLVSVLVLTGNLGLGPAWPTPAVAENTYTANVDKTTQEIRFASKSDGALTWILGGFYTHENSRLRQFVPGLTTSGKVVPTLDPSLDISLISSYDEYAAFGNVSYAITRKFTITGGLRAGENQQQYQQTGAGASLAALNTILQSVDGPAAGLPPATPVETSSESVKTYLGVAKYQFTPNAEVYFRYATGFRPGGPNVKTGASNSTFAPDTVKSYEAGFKGESADRRAALELAVYTIDWDAIQISGSAGGIAYFANAGRAASRGAELTGTLRPVGGLKLALLAAYNDAHLVDASPIIGGSVGERLPQSPRFSGTATADYQWPQNGVLQYFVGGLVRRVGDRTTSFDGNMGQPNIHLPGYTTADLRGGVQTDTLEVTAFMSNVTDDRAELSGRSIFGLNEVTIARPRTVGFMMSYHYR